MVGVMAVTSRAESVGVDDSSNEWPGGVAVEDAMNSIALISC